MSAEIEHIVEGRRDFAALIEGDSDSPLRVSAANAILRGERDEQVRAHLQSKGDSHER